MINIITLASSAISAVITALPTIGRTVTALIAKIPPPMLAQIVDIICEIVKGLAEKLFSKNDNPEELGQKAMAAEKKPEDFESTEKYINYLHNEVQVNKEEFNKLSSDEKLARSVAGIALYTGAVEEKTNMAIPPEFLVLAAVLRMNGPEVWQYLQSFKSAGLSDMTDMCDYLERKADPKNAEKIGAAILDGASKNNPELNIDQLENKISAYMEASKNDEE